MTRKIAIIGSGGHTRSSINLLLNYFDSDDIGIYDDSFTEGVQEVINSIPLVGSVGDIKSSQDIFLSIGNSTQRKRCFLKFKEKVLKENVFHSSALQEGSSKYGVSNQFFAYSYINSQVIIGDNNIINTGAIIEHEVTIGNHNHISVGVKICGRSSIGNACFIGAGVVIINKVTVCDNVTIGAGSVVIQDIKKAGIYVGNPARRIK